MTAPRLIDFAAGDAALDWITVARAIEAGHRAPRAEVQDVWLRQGPDTLLNRSAWSPGLGILVKAATVFPGNRDLPSIHGAVNLFSAADGTLEAVIDFHLVTKWKTVGDSLLGAMRLARPDSRRLLVVGAGTVAANLVEAYRAAFPGIAVAIWSRSGDSARALAAETGAEAAPDLEAAVRGADIVASATMATTPILKGAWLQPGTHLDLIGGYRPDMRETDDEAVRRATLFCDSRDTALDHVGDLCQPIADGVIAREAIVADHTQPELMARRSPDEITLFKNAGGAHLDLMVARHILERLG